MRREVRARWRRLPSFVIVFGYAILVALVLGYVYDRDATNQTLYRDAGTPGAGAVGHQLFVTLTWMQTLGWMLFAPLLTATCITSEREAGLLDALQLSYLTPWRMVWGKLLSGLAFIALMLLVPLPALAICFQLGGVAPAELVEAFALHTVTATTGAVVGLFCSAWCRRATTALGLTAAFMVGFNIAYGYFGLWYAHPLVATFGIFNHEIGLGAWVGSIVVQLGLSGLLLWNAATALVRPLPEYLPPPTLASTPVRTSTEPMPPTVTYPAVTVSQSGAMLQTPALHSAVAPGEITLSLPVTNIHFPVARWWQPPGTERLRFNNPVLQRETQHKFRFRQESAYGQFDAWPLSVTLLLVSFACIEFFLLMVEAMNTAIRTNVWWVHAHLWLFGIVIGVAFMGAPAFAREREKGLLELLLLSALTPTEIIWGKLCAPLIACGYYSLPLLLPMIFCIRILPGDRTGVSLPQALGTIAIVSATACCYTALALCLSWLCNRLAAAFIWTLLALFIVLLCAPLLFNFGLQAQWWRLAHPFLALVQLASLHAPAQIAAYASSSALLLFSVGGVLLAWLRWAMRHGARGR